MKLKAMRLDNFINFVDFEIVYDDQVTHLVGANGSGKSTVGCTAVWAGLKGIVEKGSGGQLIGDRFRFIGSEKNSADVELILVDEKAGVEVTVRNHITNTGNKITFEAPEGYRIGEDWLENLLSVALMSAKNFSQLTPKAQAIALGIDTTEFDVKMQSLKDEFTTINREYRKFGDIPRKEKVERVSISDLVKEKDRIEAENRSKQSARDGQAIKRSNLKVVEEEVADLKDKLADAETRLATYQRIVAEMKEVPADESTAPVVEKIGKAEETNIQAAEWEKNEEAKKAKAQKKAELDQNKKTQDELAKRRIEYIKSALKVPIPGLSVDDTGGLLLHDKPVREPYFSKGELEVEVARIYVATNPEMKVRFIDDFELLDEANQKTIIETLLKEDFQVITAEIRKPKSGKGVVVLRECKAVQEAKKS